MKSKVLKGGTGQIREAFDLKDYLVFLHTREAISGYFFLDKNSLRLYFWNKPNTMGSSPFLFISSNQLVYQEIKSGIIVVDFNQDHDEFEPVGYVKMSGQRTISGFGLVSAILVLLAFIAYFINRKVRLHKQLSMVNGLDPDSIDRLISEFSKRSGTKLNVDELDLVLEINHLPNPDYKRVRRSKLVGDINSRYEALHGRELINRRRHEGDKRLMEYTIS